MGKTKNRKGSIGFFILSLAVGLCFLLTSSNPAISQSQPKEIKIGLLYCMSGPLASIARLCVNGHELALEEINAKGGIKSLGGAKLKFVIGDTESKPEVAMSVAEKLITKDNVTALLGPYSSGIAFPSTQISEKYKCPNIVSGPVADQITERGFKHIFRTVYKATDNTRTALDFIKWLSEKTKVKPKTAGKSVV